MTYFVSEASSALLTPTSIWGRMFSQTSILRPSHGSTNTENGEEEMAPDVRYSG
jgi:hypothetical protein